MIISQPDVMVAFVTTTELRRLEDDYQPARRHGSICDNNWATSTAGYNGRLSELFCAVLCTAVKHSQKHTHISTAVLTSKMTPVCTLIWTLQFLQVKWRLSAYVYDFVCVFACFSYRCPGCHMVSSSASMYFHLVDVSLAGTPGKTRLWH